MKNKLIIFLTVCVISISCDRPTVAPSPSNATQTIPSLSSEFLSGRKWDYFTFICGSSLTFSGNFYKIAFGIEGDNYWYNEGSYSISNGHVFLNPTKCLVAENAGQRDCALTMGKAECYLQPNQNSLTHWLYLTCKSKSYKRVIVENTDSISYPVPDATVLAGEQRSIGGVPVITQGMRNAQTTADVMIREKPEVQSPSIRFEKELFAEESLSVPAGTQTILLARTLEKKQIHQWNNYWYYVKVGIHDGVWMFGEFVSPK